MKSLKHGRSGFTLVELLVVILIIAVLAALAFVMTSKIRKSADESVTTANLRQMGVALLSFTSENNRFPSWQGDPVWDRSILPFLGYSNLPAGAGAISAKTLPDLEGVAKIFASPADKEPRATDTYKRSFAIVPWTTNRSQGTTVRGWKDLPLNKGVRYSMLSSPETAAMVVQWHEGAPGTPNHLGAGAHAFHDIGGRKPALGTFQQVLFADGHVEKISTSLTNVEFIAKYWPGTIGNTN